MDDQTEVTNDRAVWACRTALRRQACRTHAPALRSVPPSRSSLSGARGRLGRALTDCHADPSRGRPRGGARARLHGEPQEPGGHRNCDSAEHERAAGRNTLQSPGSSLQGCGPSREIAQVPRQRAAPPVPALLVHGSLKVRSRVAANTSRTNAVAPAAGDMAFCPVLDDAPSTDLGIHSPPAVDTLAPARSRPGESTARAVVEHRGSERPATDVVVAMLRRVRAGNTVLNGSLGHFAHRPGPERRPRG